VSRVLERLLIDPSPQQCVSTFYASSGTVFSRKKHLHNTLLAWLQLISGCFQNTKSVPKGKRFSEVEDIKSSVKQILADIPVQDFENCFEGRLKHWEHCKKLERDYIEKFLDANICSS
jgi:hypothetical protein